MYLLHTTGPTYNIIRSTLPLNDLNSDTYQYTQGPGTGPAPSPGLHNPLALDVSPHAPPFDNKVSYDINTTP